MEAGGCQHVIEHQLPSYLLVYPNATSTRLGPGEASLFVCVSHWSKTLSRKIPSISLPLFSDVEPRNPQQGLATQSLQGITR